MTGPPPMCDPATGSANPSASLPALWGYIEPALDHILRSPTNNLAKAPAIDVSYHMGIHTAIYNYFTSSRHHPAPPPPGSAPAATTPASLMQAAPFAQPQPRGGRQPQLGAEVYERLDAYFAGAARELLFGAPQDVDADTLVRYLVPTYTRYAAGAAAVHRLLNYVNRQFVKRAVDEDRGWLCLNDILDAVARSLGESDGREKVAAKLRERRTAELRKWGWEEGLDPEALVEAEASAEAASAVDRVVPLVSLAHRRFRTEVLEPLLAVPKAKGKGKGKAKAKMKAAPVQNGDRPSGPKGRLARAVKELLESTDGDPEERMQLAREMARMLRMCGIRPDHPLRKRLDKYTGAAT
ncbi:hypothetical protein DENSPDRAFT_911832 [Dentipellis sp. KUC8613]|nr:hypothetical protein DENSPDRAFT_911832 [Dentipellis sp. KUC8613]